MSTRLIGAKEVAGQLGISKAYAYKLIRQLNRELEVTGCLTIPGKVSADYFEKRFFTMPNAQKRGDSCGDN
jgi:hypothetical protein